jgi:cytochrome c-type biogenesis protein CcmH/NrfF/tetratricopeptide (TPR) repeat protein
MSQHSQSLSFMLRRAQHERETHNDFKSTSVRPELVEGRTRSFSTAWRLLTFVLLLAPYNFLFAAAAPDLEDQTRIIASELRCVVCQNLSVADSPSEMAQQMRGIIREQLETGKTPQQVKDYFVSKYGAWVLLAPEAKGFSLLLWVLPFVVLGAGMLLGLWLIRRWTARKTHTQAETFDAAVSKELSGGWRAQDYEEQKPEDSGPRSESLRERGRLVAELKELEFDFQCGKLSEFDYASLRRQIEAKVASLTQHLASLPPPAKSPAKTAAPTTKKIDEGKGRFRRWRLVAGGSFLLLFGLTLGILLMNSLRPRASEQESMTGDFLTGTNAASGEVASLLDQGKAAFAKQDWPTAIEIFKKVLGADPNQPEAHSYMGFILLQAGHADGALMAFEKALSIAPNLPMALWGKGMVLYRDKQDYEGAREVFARLLQLLPAGEDRKEIEKVIADLPRSNKQTKPAPATAQTQQISGTITIDPKLKAQVDSQATLFIIARSAGAGAGPPLAVKKIERPTFPLAYSLGADNVMIPGGSFAGKINISARLDKDGNPMTREAGNLSGDYRKNPVEAGSRNVDVIIDQVTP